MIYHFLYDCFFMIVLDIIDVNHQVSSRDKQAMVKTEPHYQRIYDYLLGEIISGRLGPGAKAPSEKKLCQQFDVSRITCKRAFEMLVENGYITRFRGKGSFIRDGQAGAVPGSSRLVGLLLPDFCDAFGVNLLCEIEKNCTALGYHLLVKHTSESAAEESIAIKALTELNVAGILLIPVHGEYYSEDILKLVLEKKPLVFVDRKMRGLAAVSVSTDNIRAAEAGINHLLQLGHRKIAFYSGPIKYAPAIEDRKQGLINALVEAGIVPDPALFCHALGIRQYPFQNDDSVAGDVALVKEHLLSHPDVGAAFAAEYGRALVVKEAAVQLGLRVPEDFSILCFDAPQAVSSRPPFTSLCQDETALAEKAVESLHELISGKITMPGGDITVPARLVVGASTAPAARAGVKTRQASVQ
jgi:DNA-binding LacI/PurR family transcriptional regulator